MIKSRLLYRIYANNSRFFYISKSKQEGDDSMVTHYACECGACGEVFYSIQKSTCPRCENKDEVMIVAEVGN